MKRKFLSALLIGLASALGSADAAGLRDASAILILEGPADLDHIQLQPYIYYNEAERRGRSGIDDDDDGFIDNLRGWNFASNNADVMPTRFKSYFQDNLESIRELFAIQARIENGDGAAQLLLHLNGQADSLDEAIDMSHGTHVAGIAALRARGAAHIQNLNVSVPAELAPGERPAGPDFDNPAATEEFVAAYLRQEDATSLRASHYIRASGAGIVNISFGVSRNLIRYSYERFWREQLAAKGLAPSTRRNAAQEKLFDRLVTTHTQAQHNYWARIFDENPEVLFVIAASNEGRSNDEDVVLPANFSVTRKNVISVAATNAQGQLADFSNFGSQSVNIGAWGVAVPSLAPGDLELVMSGTSMAAPMVAAAAAQIRKLAPELSAVSVRTLLEQSAARAPSLAEKVSSGGYLDTAMALEVATQVASGEELSAALGRIRPRQARAPINPHGASGLPIFDDPFGRFGSSPGIYRSSEQLKLTLQRQAERRAWRSLQLAI